MKKAILALVVVFVVGLLGSAECIGAPKKPYVIGAIFSVTGDNAPLGKPEQDTVKMLEKQINAKGGIKGRPLKIKYYDDEGRPEQAVKACRELLSDKDVIAIIGPTLTGPSLAIAQMCNSAKMPLISCAASIKIVDPVKPYVFKTAQTDSLAVAKIIEYLKKKKITKVGFINDSNAFGASGREQWNNRASSNGIQTVAMESFASNDTDMTSQLTKIRSKNPEAVVCWGTNPGPAIVAKNMRMLGMKQPLLMSHGVANSQFLTLAGSAAEGVVLPAGKLLVAESIPASDPQKKVLLKYIAEYKKATGKQANSFGGYASDALMLVVNALKKVGSDRTKIRDYIENTRNFVGISGVFNMSKKDHNGLDKNSFTMVQVKNGKWTAIK